MIDLPSGLHTGEPPKAVVKVSCLNADPSVRTDHNVPIGVESVLKKTISSPSGEKAGERGASGSSRD